MADKSDTDIKTKAKGFDLLVKVLPLILAGIAGGAGTGGVLALGVQNGPVPNGVAKEVALEEVRKEIRAVAQQFASYQAANDARMAALVESVGFIRGDLKDLAREVRERK